MIWNLVATTTGFFLVGAGIGALLAFSMRSFPHPAEISIKSAALISGLAWGAAGWRWLSDALSTPWLPTVLVLSSLGIPLLLADWRHCRLPNPLTLSAYPLCVVALLMYALHDELTTFEVLSRALIAMVLFGGVHAMVHWIKPASLGAGDVKLVGVLGGICGAISWEAAFAMALLSAVITLVIAVMPRKRSARGAPHGPGLLLSTWIIAIFPALFVPSAETFHAITISRTPVSSISMLGWQK